MKKEKKELKVKSEEDQKRLLQEHLDKKNKTLEKKVQNEHHYSNKRTYVVKEGKEKITWSDGDVWIYDYSINQNGPVETISANHKQESLRKKKEHKTTEKFNEFFK